MYAMAGAPVAEGVVTPSSHRREVPNANFRKHTAGEMKIANCVLRRSLEERKWACAACRIAYTQDERMRKHHREVRFGAPFFLSLHRLAENASNERRRKSDSRNYSCYRSTRENAGRRTPTTSPL